MKMFYRVALLATALAFCVIVLGAYVRLSDAGLGCPDWPGCYGQILVPSETEQLQSANELYPHRPVESAKAWKEMVHRYFASALGLLIIALAAIAWRNRRTQPTQPLLLPLVLVVLVIFQGLLGMWTVTLLLKPVVVMAHLLGGLTTLSMLWWLSLREGSLFYSPVNAVPIGLVQTLRVAGILLICVLVGQIALGGWTSANYAALHCPDFPTCQGAWWPQMDFAEGFTLWREIGVNYEGGVLSNEARVAIHFTHRLGAIVTFILLSAYVLRLLQVARDVKLKRAAQLTGVLLITQVGLGITNVISSLPLPVAVAHNGVAALLLLSLITLNHMLRPRTMG